VSPRSISSSVSHLRHVPFASAIAEAMMHGLEVVTTRVGLVAG